MAEFRHLLEELGYSQVRTLLNSGNAVFESSGRAKAKHAQAIAAALQARFGVSTPVIVKSAAELAAIVRGNPIVPPDADHSRFLVAMAADGATLQSLKPLVSLAHERERFVITKDAAYLHCPGALLESKVAEALLGKVGKSVTSRNWATVLKLAAHLER
jgi:uncharacterized protein (DUF1697 family)